METFFFTVNPKQSRAGTEDVKVDSNLGNAVISVVCPRVLKTLQFVF